MRLWGVKKTDRFHNLFGIVLLTTALIIQSVPLVFAAPLLANRYDKTSTSQAGATGSHMIGFSFTNFAAPIGSVEFEFCSNDPIPENACVAPAGFNASGVVILNQTGEGGFSIHPNSTSNDIILTRLATVPVAASSSYELDTIVNPNFVGTYYVRLRTFSSNDATGAVIEQGGIALSTAGQITVSTEVPPYLYFCAGVTITAFDCSTANSFFIDFGEFLTTQSKSASSEIVVATNAAFGYTITAHGTTLTSGTNTIPALISQAPSVPGTSQFGVNLRANTMPAIGADPSGPGTASVAATYNSPNLFKYNDADSLVTTANSNDFRKFTISYLANINSSQAPGYYATTLSFICLANF